MLKIDKGVDMCYWDKGGNVSFYLTEHQRQLEEAIGEAESELRFEGFLPLGKPRFIEQHLAELRKVGVLLIQCKDKG